MNKRILVSLSIILAAFSIVFACYLVYRPLSALLEERRQAKQPQTDEFGNQFNSSGDGLGGENGYGDGYDDDYNDGINGTGSGAGSGSETQSGSDNNSNAGNVNRRTNSAEAPSDGILDSSGAIRAWERLMRYTELINDRGFEEMYAMLYPKSKEDIAEESFVTRNSNIYEGIGANNLTVDLSGSETQTDGRVLLWYTTRMESSAGAITFPNQAAFTPGEDGEYYLEWSPKQIFPLLTGDDRVRASTLRANRGSIYDRNGEILASNGFIMNVGLVPGRMRKDGDVGADKAKIAGLLGTTVDAIDKKLNASYVRDDTFVEITKVSSTEEDLREELLSIPGVMINDVASRVYPLGEKAAHLTGYVQNITADELKSRSGMGYHSGSIIGKAGLESIFEDQLRATDGFEIYIQGVNNEKKQTLAISERKDGDNIRLTIDARIQRELFDQFSQDKSCAVALNPVTGEILALVSTPSYDPNGFIIGMTQQEWDSINQNPDMPMFNRFRAALTPGSSFKPVVGAIGVSLGKFQPNDNFGASGLTWQNDPSWGAYYVRTLREYSGGATLKNALVVSDNIYFAKAAVKTGADDLARELLRIGFTKPVPFEYPLTASVFSTAETFKSEIQLADSGYGQGELLVNPVHLASIYTAFINNGNMLLPRIIYGSTGGGGGSGGGGSGSDGGGSSGGSGGGGSSGDGGGSGGDTVEGGSGSSSGIDESDADLGSDDINMVSGSSDSGAPGLWIDATGSRIWIEGAFSPEAAEAVRDGLIEAVERGTGREAKMEGVRLAGKTGTAEIKQSKDDVTGTELGWFVLLTADTDASHPLLIAAMVEDVRGRGGSSYVVPKVSSAFRAVLYL